MNHGTPTTSANNTGKKRNIVMANDGKVMVSSTKKARTTPAPHPTQASITPTSSLNATGIMVMSDRGESQSHSTRKRSSQAADDNVVDATPVRPSKKVKTTESNKPPSQSLRRTGSSSIY